MVVPLQTDRRLLWHPRHDNKFIVGGGSQISLYEWAPEAPEIRHVTSQQDLQYMKCFAWSPDPAFDDLIAVGLNTGRVDLIRLEANKLSQNHILSSGPPVSLPVRNSRACNSLAFCSADPNYLAVGLEKVRGDSSLVVWDINRASSSASFSSGVNHSVSDAVSSRPQPQIPRIDSGPRTDSRMLQQHAQAEVVSAVTFLPKSTNLLLAGISHRWLRIFDLRNSPPSTTTAAAKVHGIATDPFDPHRIGCFGDGIITIWDTRRFSNPLLTFTEKDASADGAKIRPHSTFTAIEFSSTRRGTLAALEKDSTYVRFWDIQHSQSGSHPVDGERSRDSSQSSRVHRRSWAGLPWSSSSTHIPGESQTPPYTTVLSDTRKTKHFPRPLASFALVPSTEARPLTSNIMVVNKDGDLELYAMHDTPKQVSWSSRGDLSIGTGQSCRILPGFQDIEPLNEPWDVLNASYIFLTESVRSDQYDGSVTRGRAPTNLAATRPGGRGRTNSPTSLLYYSHQHSVEPPVRSPATQVVRLDETSKTRRLNREKSATRARKPTTKSINNIVEEDISMTMRHRVARGYGLSNPKLNLDIVRDDSSEDTMLAELWAWINHSRELLFMPTPVVHGYDFSYQGLVGIWEGFQSLPQHSDSAAPTPRNLLLDLPPPPHATIVERTHSAPAPSKVPRTRSHSPIDDVHGDFHAALLALLARSGRSAWKPTTSTAKLAQRRLALQLCGWDLGEDGLNLAIRMWEKEEKHSRAACWLVFTKQYAKAAELLMKSKDESHHMMSGTIAALTMGQIKNPELREHCERLVVRLHDPYFRAILTQLTSNDWSEVLEEDVLPLRERLAIAFQFLDDTALTTFLRRVVEYASAQGDIEGILVTGLTRSGMSVLQSYVDRTGDVQTAAILSAYISPMRFTDTRTERWQEAYRDMLDGFKLFHHRVHFDTERGQLLREAAQSGGVDPSEWTPPQVLFRCNYCNKAVSGPGLSNQKERVTSCPHCGRSLPRCSICLMALGIVQDSVRDNELAHSHFKDTIDEAIVVCQTCRHGGHASHILDWFFGEDGGRAHVMCAVADCDCACAEEF